MKVLISDTGLDPFPLLPSTALFQHEGDEDVPSEAPFWGKMARMARPTLKEEKEIKRENEEPKPEGQELSAMQKRELWNAFFQIVNHLEDISQLYQVEIYQAEPELKSQTYPATTAVI